MPFRIVETDITTCTTDVIVNAANSELYEGGGVCGAIFRKAGASKMRQACRDIGHCNSGEAVITSGFDLPSAYVIHTVGPVWYGGNRGEEKTLRACYRNSLELAKTFRLSSIAFPLISSGIYGYPFDKALAVAVDEIKKFLFSNEMEVFIVIHNRKSFILPSLLNEVSLEIEKSKVEKQVKEVDTNRVFYSYSRNPSEFLSFSCLEVDKTRLPKDYQPEGKTFSETLLAIIIKKGLDEVEVYKKANVSRQVFSKIRSNRDYRPLKKTAVAFALALELTIDEANSLLQTAGYVLSSAILYDKIIICCLNRRIFDIFDIDLILFRYEQEPFYKGEK